MRSPGYRNIQRWCSWMKRSLSCGRVLSPIPTLMAASVTQQRRIIPTLFIITASVARVQRQNQWVLDLKHRQRSSCSPCPTFNHLSSDWPLVWRWSFSASLVVNVWLTTGHDWSAHSVTSGNKRPQVTNVLRCFPKEQNSFNCFCLPHNFYHSLRLNTAAPLWNTSFIFHIHT